MGALGRDRTGLSALLSGALVGVLISIAPGQIRIVGGGVAVGGSTTYVQFNDAGALGGDAGLTYNKTTDVLTVGAALFSGGVGIKVSTTDGQTLLVDGDGTVTIQNADTGGGIGLSAANSPDFGGNVSIAAGGASDASASGGQLDLLAGTANGAGQTGGALTLYAGGGLSGANAGNIVLNGGEASGGGASGVVILNAGGATWTYSKAASLAMLAFPATTFANLGTPDNGAFVYCSDCTIANPCAGSSTGAFAKRLNGVWVCN